MDDATQKLQVTLTKSAGLSPSRFLFFGPTRSTRPPKSDKIAEQHSDDMGEARFSK